MTSSIGEMKEAVKLRTQPSPVPAPETYSGTDLPSALVLFSKLIS